MEGGLPLLATSPDAWPNNISQTTFYAIWATPVIFWALFWIWLRVIDKPDGTAEEKKSLKKSHVLEPGVLNGDYSSPWYQTFDLAFLVFMTAYLVIISIWTEYTVPQLWSNRAFWIAQLPKLFCMLFVSVLGGIAARYFSGYYARDGQNYAEFDVTVDGQASKKARLVCTPDGYLLSEKGHWFQINYTRKLQHFAAYAVPVVFPSPHGCEGPLYLAWGDFFTMIGFLILIKPLRESFDCLMLQFHALDRPEDRPHTLKWIIGGNILPGLFLIIIFRYFLASFGADPALALIFILVTGVGDGLAEPVGIAWGKHKYRTWSIDWRCCRRLTEEDLMELNEEPERASRKSWYEDIAKAGPEDAEYQRIAGKDDKPKWRTLQMWTRSLEGSACVFLSCIIFTATSYRYFKNANQFWFTMFVMPIPMTLSEAYSPHTMDTPFLMTVGGLILLAAVTLFP